MTTGAANSGSLHDGVDIPDSAYRRSDLRATFHKREKVYIHCFLPIGGGEHDLARSISQQAHSCIYISQPHYDYTPVFGFAQSPPPSPTPFE